MGVLTSKLPGRSQELLQYMSLIRHAAQTHRGLDWCIYDHKFRRKAALNATLKWSEIDQQLWLCIFTVSPEILRREYPLFSNGPQPTTSSGAVRGGICHEYNRKANINTPSVPTVMCATDAQVAIQDTSAANAHQNMTTPPIAASPPDQRNAKTDHKLPTPLLIDNLEYALTDHPDKQFVVEICSNLRGGARIGLRGKELQGFS